MIAVCRTFSPLAALATLAATLVFAAPVQEDVQEAFRRGETTPTAVTEAYLARIGKLDGTLGAYITVTADQARAAAAAADRRYRAGAPLGSLDGVPLAIKDVFCTRGVPTTAGSRILERFVPPYDATLVQRLAAGGAVMLGKGNLDEFAMGSSTEHSGFHVTRNPWDLERVPGGSSGGSVAGNTRGSRRRVPRSIVKICGAGYRTRLSTRAFAGSPRPSRQRLAPPAPRARLLSGRPHLPDPTHCVALSRSCHQPHTRSRTRARHPEREACPCRRPNSSSPR